MDLRHPVPLYYVCMYVCMYACVHVCTYVLHVNRLSVFMHAYVLPMYNRAFLILNKARLF